MADVKAPALNPSLVKHAEFTRNVWSVTVPPGVPMQSVLDPEFWGHCATKFKVYDKIEVRAQDNKWYAELVVSKVERLAVRVWCILHSDLSSQVAVAPKLESAAYGVSHGGPQKWRVVRLSDKQVVHHGEPSKEDAEGWLTQYLAGAVQADPT